MSDMNEMKKVLRNIINGMKDERLTKCLKKWFPYICKSVDMVSYITGEDPVDILSRIMISIVEANIIYDVPLYRHDGRLWELEKVHGKKMFMRSPRNNKGAVEHMTVQSDEVEQVRKSKIESTIYREITQSYIDVINAHLTQKNGYKKTKTDTKMVVVHSGQAGTYSKVRNTDKVEKFIDVVSMSDMEVETWSDSCFTRSDEQVLYKEYVRDLFNVLSDDAREVLDVMVHNHGVNDKFIARTCSMSNRKVEAAKSEIFRGVKIVLGMATETEGFEPIYLSADQVAS